MQVFRSLVFAVALFGVAGENFSVQAEDRVVGILWQLGGWRDDKPIWGPIFRATADKKVWSHGERGLPKVIGEWSGTEENTKAKVTGINEGKNQRYNGDYEFVLIEKDPKLWRGKFKPIGSEKEYPIQIRLVRE